MDDAEDFYDIIGTEAETWECPGAASCSYMKHAQTMATIFDKNTIPNTVLGYVKKCRICRKFLIVPSSVPLSKRKNANINITNI